MALSEYASWEVRSYEDHYTVVVVTHGPSIFGNACASNAGVAPQGMLQTHRGCEGVRVSGPCCDCSMRSELCLVARLEVLYIG